MKTAQVELQGKNYTICLSLNAILNIQEKGIELNKLENTNTRDLIFIVHQMMVAGDKYCKLNKKENPDVPSLEDLGNTCDLIDLINAIQSLSKIKDLQQPDIEIEEDEKN